MTESVNPGLAGSALAGRDRRTLSAESLPGFLGLVPDAAVVVDAEGGIVALNRRAERLFAYDEGELVGRPIEQLVPERARQRHRGHRTLYIQAPERRLMGAGLELVGRRKDGSEFPVDVSLAPFESGGRQLVVAAVRDVTEQHAATEAQAELAAIILSSFDAIISTTLDARITSWNPAARALFGYEEDEILGRHVATLVPSDASVVLEELLALAAEGTYHGAQDTRWQARDGHEVDVAVSISPLRDRSGSLLGFSFLVRDVSERKQTEHELRRLLAEEQRLERQHAATAAIRLALLSYDSLADSLSLVCDQATELLASSVAVISVRDGDELRVIAASDPARPMIGKSLPGDLAFSRFVFENSAPHAVARRSDHSGLELGDYVPDGPTLGVPVIVGGVANAVLAVVRNPGAAEYTAGDINAAESLAAQTALAFELERARRDREQMMLVGDRERIARDLHDLVIQQLFAVGMVLQGAIPFIERPAVQERVSDAIDSLDETIREIRNTIYGLSQRRPGVRALREQVLELARLAAETLGFEPTVRFEGPVDTTVPTEVVPHVLAVVREALSNVARHAEASSVRVEVTLREAQLRVSVADDGVGIGEPARSSGLSNLEERARLFEGVFEIGSPPAGGTRLEWRVPIGA